MCRGRCWPACGVGATGAGSWTVSRGSAGLEPDASFRSSFIIGYPGETEDDHDLLLRFLEDAQLDWAGFFLFSPEPGTAATALSDPVPSEVAWERLRECTEVQDRVTQLRRDRWIGRSLRVLVDGPGVARSVHEAPEIDGIVRLDPEVATGTMPWVTITGAVGPDLVADPDADRRVEV